MKSVTILGIESSCDDTSAAVIQDGKLLSNIISTQSVHKEYGGVVPELASRAHQQNIVPVVQRALDTAKINKKQLEAIGFTRGPGLLGALLVGTSFSKALSLSLDIPLIEVNHMQAHVLAHFIKEPHPKFPFLCLTVSGGHTQLVRVNSPQEMHVIGETMDDAVGEAFDKAAKMLGLSYPGGPLIDQNAQLGNPEKFVFPQAEMKGYNFSFSGIKTSLLYFLRSKKADDKDFIEQNMADICASYQQALINMLVKKLTLATRNLSITEVAIAGGVSANSQLRKEVELMSQKKGWKVFIPDVQYCTDNAGMIAMAAYFKYLRQDFSDLSVSATARMSL